MKIFQLRELKAAIQHAAEGGQALHMLPASFAHLFDQDKDRLFKTARSLGVRKILVEREGTESQHVDLCGKPLQKAMEQASKAPSSEQTSLPLAEPEEAVSSPSSQVAAWNARHPVGTPVVRYKLIKPPRFPFNTTTTSPARVLDGVAVVMLENLPDPTPLAHLTPALSWRQRLEEREHPTEKTKLARLRSFDSLVSLGHSEEESFNASLRIMHIH